MKEKEEKVNMHCPTSFNHTYWGSIASKLVICMGIKMKYKMNERENIAGGKTMEGTWSEKTIRVERLLAGLRDTTEEQLHFTMQKEVIDIGKIYDQKNIMLRKALAIKAFLNKLTEGEQAEYAGTYQIKDDELIVGVDPIGKSGSAWSISNYLTQEEKRITVLSNVSESCLWEHDTIDFQFLLEQGLEDVIADAEDKLRELGEKKEESQRQADYYIGVVIICKAIITYAEKYACLAEKKAEKLEEGSKRKKELEEIARICRKVPGKRPDTYHEALQSIFIFHVAFHCSLDYLSLGRLDQVLDKYLDKNRIKEKEYRKECIELFACFLIKIAEPERRFEAEQAFNFIQNIIIGGITPKGEDAANDMTYIILNACTMVDLSVPVIYIRVGRKSPQKFIKTIARVLSITKNKPKVLDDDILIPQFYRAMIKEEDHLSKEKKKEYKRIINDYCIDGNWKPVSQGSMNCSFLRLNGIPILKSVVNKGAARGLHSNNIQEGKLIFLTQEETEYEKSMFQSHFFSAVVDTCMEWGKGAVKDRIKF